MLKHGILLAALLWLPSAYALDWSSTQLEWLHGTAYHEPFNPQAVTKDILTFQHADGHSYGRNFLFVDFLQSDRTDRHATEIYGEGYSSLSLNKLGITGFSSGAIRDINLTVGLNYGHKTYPTHTVNPRVLLPGVTVDFNAPGFNFLSVDFLAYIDRGLFAGQNNGCHTTGWQVTPAWEHPFAIGSENFVFEGFVDVIGRHGACSAQVLSQPRLRWDIGRHFGAPNHLYIGMEFQYWRNKYGVQQANERVFQSMAMWKF